MVIASQMGCSDQEKCYSEGGMDVATAEAICAHECNIKLPRDEGGIHYAFLDGCGGHTKVRNGHERQGKEREGRMRERESGIAMRDTRTAVRNLLGLRV